MSSPPDDRPASTNDPAAIASTEDGDLDAFAQEFDTSLTAMETEVRDLRDRFDRTRDLWQRRRQGDRRIDTVRPNLARARDRDQRQAFANELRSLEHRQQALDLALLEQLPIAAALREWFWQAVRFGGLGVLLGWLLGRWGS